MSGSGWRSELRQVAPEVALRTSRSSPVARRCAHASTGAHRNTGTQEHRKLAHKQLAHRRASYCLETLWPLQPRAARAMSACSTLAERASCTQESKQEARPSAQEAATHMAHMAQQDPYDQSVQEQLDGLQRRLAILSAEVAYLPMDAPEQRALNCLADVVSRLPSR